MIRIWDSDKFFYESELDGYAQAVIALNLDVRNYSSVIAGLAHMIYKIYGDVSTFNVRIDPVRGVLTYTEVSISHPSGCFFGPGLPKALALVLEAAGLDQVRVGEPADASTGPVWEVSMSCREAEVQTHVIGVYALDSADF